MTELTEAEINPADVLTERLDTVLRELIKHDVERRRVRRDLDKREEVCMNLENEAQRLRMALYALGDERKSMGDANSDNLQRRSELMTGPRND